MIDYAKNMLIGLFVVIACGLIIGMILFLEPTVGDGKETLKVRFSNINGLSVGTRVLFAGKPVGEVVSIEQIKHAREQPTDELGQVYFYQLNLHVDSSVRVYNTDLVTVQTSGLLGEKSIAIIPKAPPRGVKPTLLDQKSLIYAESNDPLESAFSEISNLSEKVEETLDKVIYWIDQNGDELSASIRSFDETMYEASILLSNINNSDLINSLLNSIDNFSKAMNNINNAINVMDDFNTFQNLGSSFKNIKSATSYLDNILEIVSSGKGTIGELLTQDGIYLQVNAILSKLDTMMNDINHYGFLFNLNKEWQRTRLKQATILNALKTPANFKQYFNREVDLINTAMSRISMLINKAENMNEGDSLIDNKAFQKDFLELLERSKTLHTNLQLYNNQIKEMSN